MRKLVLVLSLILSLGVNGQDIYKVRSYDELSNQQLHQRNKVMCGVLMVSTPFLAIVTPPLALGVFGASGMYAARLGSIDDGSYVAKLEEKNRVTQMTIDHLAKVLRWRVEQKSINPNDEYNNSEIGRLQAKIKRLNRKIRKTNELIRRNTL